MDSTTIEQMIRAGLPDADVTVSGEDGVHFEARVICESFRGKSTLQRHRMVYAAVDSLMPAEIHALSIEALASNENS